MMFPGLDDIGMILIGKMMTFPCDGWMLGPKPRDHRDGTLFLWWICHGDQQANDWCINNTCSTMVAPGKPRVGGLEHHHLRTINKLKRASFNGKLFVYRRVIFDLESPQAREDLMDWARSAEATSFWRVGMWRMDAFMVYFAVLTISLISPLITISHHNQALYCHSDYIDLHLSTFINGLGPVSSDSDTWDGATLIQWLCLKELGLCYDETQRKKKKTRIFRAFLGDIGYRIFMDFRWFSPLFWHVSDKAAWKLHFLSSGDADPARTLVDPGSEATARKLEIGHWGNTSLAPISRFSAFLFRNWIATWCNTKPENVHELWVKHGKVPTFGCWRSFSYGNNDIFWGHANVYRLC